MKTPLIKSWINDFIADHEATHRESGFPWRNGDIGKRLWGEWFDAIKGAGITETEARAASGRIAPDLPWDEHPGRLVSLVTEGRLAAQERATQPGPEISDRDSAVAASRDCPHCRGEGLCDVFDPKYDGRRVVYHKVMIRGEFVRQPFPTIVAAHCICPLGRWMRLKTDPATRRRIPDLVEVLAGQSRYVAQDPRGD